MKKTTTLIVVFIALVVIALAFVPRKKVNAPDTDNADGNAMTSPAMALAGTWIGPEGTALTIEPIASTLPQKYRLNFVLLDGPISVISNEVASGSGEITFTRNFQPLALWAGTGDETGMKYLTGQKDCIVVAGTKSSGRPTPPEGYCRNGIMGSASSSVSVPVAPRPSVSNPPAGDLSAKLNAANGRTYRLISVNGIGVGSFGTAPKLTFGPKFGDLNAKFCNGMGGTFTMKDDVMKAQLIGTQMYCETPAGLMDYELQFASMLSSGASVSLAGGKVTFTATGGKSMVFMQEIMYDANMGA